MKKTVGILTLYDALNYGAFLQAYALQLQLEKIGCATVFVKNNGVSKRHLLNLFKYKKGWWKFVGFRTLTKLTASWKLLKIEDNPSFYNSIVIGSDEVWSIKNDEFNHLPSHFSIGLNAEKRVAYAPSFGSTRLSDIQNTKYVVEGLRNFTALSARDINTQDILERITKSTVPIVLDPTLLVDFNTNDYSFDLNNYIFIYYLGYNNGQVKEIVEFAKRAGKKLVCAGIHNFHFWCDKYEITTPLGLLKLIQNADQVITNTFHGTILSIKYNKNFCSFSDKRPKVKMALDMFSLKNRDGSFNSVNDVLNSEIDYRIVNENLDSLREKSVEYLRRSVL